ncbi:MAG: acyl-CoA dehydrogenase family protein [Pseudomonadota bacterium]
MSERLSSEVRHWLALEADALDSGRADPEAVLPVLAGSDLFRVGVPTEVGGLGGSIGDAVEVLASVASHSLTVAFVYWSQRTFIEYVVATPYEAPRERWLSPLLDGQLAGATGLSNAMKFLSGIEELEVKVAAEAGSFSLQGRAPWVTNLRKSGFVVAVAAEGLGGDPWVVAVRSETPGMTRSPDLRLLALQSSNTAALRFERAEFDEGDVLHRDARAFIAQVRPAFLGLQCGLSIGLARASLRAAGESSAARGGAVEARLTTTQRRLDHASHALIEGLLDGRFVSQAGSLFALRIEFAAIAQAAVELELCSSGGRAYLSDRDRGFARRWREAAFIPIVTPSLLQLEHELSRRAEGPRA